MLDYEKKLEEIRDKVANLTPEKWIGEESDYSDVGSEQEFEVGDLTPIKGSVSKIERKRRIFDMIKAFNETLQKVYMLSSLKQFQAVGIQKLQFGKIF
jgi:hypothetical protein